MEEKISIIVPVFNMENYLNRCVKSIINQTYSNLEILLINDGSTDSSLELCHHWASLDDRIVVFDKENGGLSDARNYGVKQASGDYIGFVDSDDDIEPSMIEILYEMIKLYKADVAECNMNICYPSHKQLYTKEKYLEVLDTKGYLKEYLIMHKLFGSVCTKLIRKDIAKKLYFPKGKLYEDTYYSLQLIREAKKYVISDAPMYNYYMRNGSITNSSFSPKMLDLAEIVDDFYDFVLENYSDLQQEVEYRQMYAYLSVLNAILQEKNFKDNFYYKKFKSYFSVNFKNLLKNPHITLVRKLCVILICSNIRVYKFVLKKYINRLNRS